VPAPLRAQLDASVTQIASLQAEQGANASAAKGETAKQKLLRGDLYAHLLNPVGGVARKQLRS
jgi:hypothetical protein